MREILRWWVEYGGILFGSTRSFPSNAFGVPNPRNKVQVKRFWNRVMLSQSQLAEKSFASLPYRGCTGIHGEGFLYVSLEPFG